MAKAKTTAFFCKECGYESSKWLGQCPACRAWNTLVEEPVAGTASAAGKGRMSSDRGAGRAVAKPALLSEIRLEQEDRISTGFKELDRVLGDGIVAGSLVLVGGDPGIGKSTLLLQVCRHLAADGQKVLYISGEESLKQIKMRANRIGTVTGELRFLSETNLERIEAVIDQEKPQIVVIDSIQIMYREEITSAPGSVSQVRESTGVLMQIAKSRGIAIFVVGHVTKEGVVAGPRVLEHMVDTVLYLEGERYFSYRILRGVKNRFGSTNEVGMFEMQSEGMKEITNPSSVLISERKDNPPGSVIVAAMEGTRPLLIELQALTTLSVYGLPRRTANGIDYNRLTLLIAVLEKKLGFALGNQDVYLNVVSGIKISEPAVDLGIIISCASSFKNISIPTDTVVIGEVGLTGEVRAVNLIDKRLKEAEKLGFKTCIIPESNKKLLKESYKLDIIGVNNIKEAIQAVGLR